VALLRFATFELDERTGELRRSGRLVHLSAQPTRVLLLLASRPGMLVTREELFRHLWGEGTFVAFDQGLNFCLSRIRLALGDNPRVPRFVETVPRRGYRFLASVMRVEVCDDVVAVPQPSLPRHVLRVPLGLAMTVLVLAAQRGAPTWVHSRQTALPAAHAAFKRGSEQFEADAAGRRRSVYAFREAIRADPLFAEAHFAIADTLLRLGEEGEIPVEAAMPEARRAAEAALALEDAPATRNVLASVNYYYDWDWSGARHHLEAALRAAPDSDGVLTSYARYLSAVGADDAAVRTIDRAEARAPACDLVAHESGWVRYRARRYADAIRKFDQSIAFGPPRGRDPKQWQAWNRSTILRVHALEGAWEQARGDAVTVMQLVGVPDGRVRAIAALAPREAVEAFWRGSLDVLRRRSEKEYVPKVRLAELHALCGDSEAALDLLERSAAEREPALAYSVRNPDFDSVRGTTRFQALLARMGLAALHSYRSASIGPTAPAGSAGT